MGGAARPVLYAVAAADVQAGVAPYSAANLAGRGWQYRFYCTAPAGRIPTSSQAWSSSA
ncbi:MAG: hypothetical protein JW748_13590 [Anaerolineales bacterium]|nr:hypothetical protein [Anaerolineales bacterium]